MAINLADLYRIAKLFPTADTIERRQRSLDKLLKNLKNFNITDLVRLHFDLPIPNSLDWFIKFFRKDDASFSLEDNSREAALLSTYLIEHLIANKHIFATTSLLTASFSENRSATIGHSLVSLANHTIKSMSISEYNNTDIKTSSIPLTLKNTLGTKETLEADLANNPNALIDNLLLINEELSLGFSKLATNTKKAIDELVTANNHLFEETSILWWHIGAWSETLDCPLEDLSLAECAIVIGIDLAELSTSTVGPVAAQALLFRTIQAHSEMCTNKKITLEEGVNNLRQKIEKLPLKEDCIDKLSDICPVLNALSKAKNNSKQDGWKELFTQSSHLPADIELSPLDLAMQSYREHLACYAYEV